MPVAIKYQTGNNPNKWDKTGNVLENKSHPSSSDQSGRVQEREQEVYQRGWEIDNLLWPNKNALTMRGEGGVAF